MRHPGVAQAAVIAREDQPGQQAAGGLCGGGRRSERRMPLRCGRILAQSLPDYMVPSAFVVLERLPLTPNGKLDRRALPAPDLTAQGGARGRARRRRRCCAGCLPRCWGCERVGIDDNFFELGGHSLLATRLISRIRATLDVEIAIRALFEAPTVEALAKRLHEGEAARPALAGAVARPAEIPLSFAQRRLWFLRSPGRPERDLQHPDGRAAYGARWTRLPWRRRWAMWCERHESLRTIFPDTLGVPRQLILERRAARPRLEVEQRRPRRRLPRLVAAAAGQGFDLASEPPLRAHLFVLGDSEHVLLAAAAPHCRRRLVAGAAVARSGGAPMRRGWRAARRSCRSCRCNMPTTRCGSTRFWARRTTPGSAIARQLAFWTAASQGSSRSDRAADRPAAAGGAEPSRRQCSAAYRGRAASAVCWRWPATAGRACSWCCRRRWRRC